MIIDIKIREGFFCDDEIFDCRIFFNVLFILVNYGWFFCFLNVDFLVFERKSIKKL